MNPAQLPQREPPVRRLILRLIATVCRFPRAVLALALLAVAVSGWAAATRLQYHTQRTDLISADKDYQRRWQAYLSEFGDDDDIVLVVRGTDPDKMKTAIEQAATGVRQHDKLLDRLFYKADLRSLHSRALVLLPEANLQPIDKHIQGMNRLLDFGLFSWQRLGLLPLLREAQERAGHVRPGYPLTSDDAEFFAQLERICSSAEAFLADPTDYRPPWGGLGESSDNREDLLAEPQYFFAADHTLAFLLVRPIKEPGSFTAAQKSVDAMHGIVADLRKSYPDLEFGLTGMPVLETDEMAAADRDTHWASWLALGSVSLLFLIVYRSVSYPLLTIVTLVVGTVWALGWLTLTVGHLNILTSAFAVMLIGMGDYGVLWVMRYEQARKQGMDVPSALLHTASHVAIGNLTAASTLALAFFAAIFADFKAVAELGWIAGCGVIFCAFACFTVLPALLMLFDRRTMPGFAPDRAALPLLPFRSLWARSAQDAWLPSLWSRPRLILGVGAVLVLVAGACATQVRYDHNLLHLQDQTLESVHWEMILVEQTSGASWHALSITDTQEQALALKARYEKCPEVSRVVEVASLVPSDQTPRLALIKDIRDRLERLPPRNQRLVHELGPTKFLRSVLHELQARATPGSPLAALAPHFEALAKRLDEYDDGVASEKLRRFDERLAGDLRDNLYGLRDVATPTPVAVADLPPDLRDRQIGKHGKWLVRVFARDCLWDYQPLERFCAKVKEIDPEATGKPFGTVEGLKAMKDGLIRAGFYAFGVIAFILLLDFRKWRHVLVALAPLLLGVLLVLGVLGACDIPLSPANMIAFPLILGVGVDNGVHVLHDYLIRRREGLATAGSPPISSAIGRGVMVKALTSMLSFGALMISTERGLASLGFILALGVCCSMLTALFFLPAALALSREKQTAASTTSAPEEEEQQDQQIHPLRLVA